VCQRAVVDPAERADGPVGGRCSRRCVGRESGELRAIQKMPTVDAKPPGGPAAWENLAGTPALKGAQAKIQDSTGDVVKTCRGDYGTGTGSAISGYEAGPGEGELAPCRQMEQPVGALG